MRECTDECDYPIGSGVHTATCDEREFLRQAIEDMTAQIEERLRESAV